MSVSRLVASAAYPPARRREGALDLMGVTVHPVDSSQVLGFIADVIAQGRRAAILHLNVFGANLAARHRWLKEYYGDAPLVFCDGDGIRWGLRILGLPAPPKITYREWLVRLASWCEERGFSMYLLGARPGVATEAARNLAARHPRLRIAGTHDGYFDKEGPETDAVVAQINGVRPDVLLVCFGMPAQERWVRDNSPRLAAHVVLTGGAALDYAAGIVPMTPPWMARYHMEWLFRFLREPVRLFGRYIIGNPRFMARVLVERLRRDLGRGERPRD